MCRVFCKQHFFLYFDLCCGVKPLRFVDQAYGVPRDHRQHQMDGDGKDLLRRRIFCERSVLRLLFYGLEDPEDGFSSP